MYTIGFTKTERPDVLINPVSCPTEISVYDWIKRFFNPEDFTLEIAITQEAIKELLGSNNIGRINIDGYEVALLLGETETIQEATTRYIHLTPRSADNLDFEKVVDLEIPH